MKNILLIVLFACLVLVSVANATSDVNIFGESFRVTSTNGRYKTYEISFYVRNYLDEDIYSICVVPHLYNEHGEIFQHHYPGDAQLMCSDSTIPSGGIQRIIFTASDYRATAIRIEVEKEYILTVGREEIDYSTYRK